MLFEKGSTQKARQIAVNWLSVKLESAIDSISLGLPEYDDRFKRWHVPLHLNNGNHFLIGEVYIDEQITKIIDSTDIKLIKPKLSDLKSDIKISVKKCFIQFINFGNFSTFHRSTG
jgi:hypothetical protein